MIQESPVFYATWFTGFLHCWMAGSGWPALEGLEGCTDAGDSSRDLWNPLFGGHLTNHWFRVTWTHHPKKVSLNHLVAVFFCLCFHHFFGGRGKRCLKCFWMFLPEIWRHSSQFDDGAYLFIKWVGLSTRTNKFYGVPIGSMEREYVYIDGLLILMGNHQSGMNG